MVDSTPSRFLQGQDGSDTRHLALDIFGGEVFTAFHMNTVFGDKIQSRTISGGLRSARFPKVWKAAASYHTAGTEMLGQTISTSEISITVDAILKADTAVYDLDDILSHFDVRGPFSRELGLALAEAYDKNIARSIIQAARTAADGPFPGGTVVTDSSLTNTGTIDGVAWLNAIRTANIALYNLDVPESLPRYVSVNANVFDAIRWAKDSNGNYLVIDRTLNNGANSDTPVAGRPQMLRIDDVTVIRSRNMPTVDETSVTTVYSKYRANFSTTTGMMWVPMAAAVLKLRDINMEHFRDVRRQEDFMVSKMLVGHGTLRPECAVEFKTS